MFFFFDSMYFVLFILRLNGKHEFTLYSSHYPGKKPIIFRSYRIILPRAIVLDSSAWHPSTRWAQHTKSQIKLNVIPPRYQRWDKMESVRVRCHCGIIVQYLCCVMKSDKGSLENSSRVKAGTSPSSSKQQTWPASAIIIAYRICVLLIESKCVIEFNRASCMFWWVPGARECE